MIPVLLGFFMWRLWCLALGEKASNKNKEADAVALIRTLIFISYLTTNLFIVRGIIRHWNKCSQENVNVSSVTEKNLLSTKRR